MNTTALFSDFYGFEQDVWIFLDCSYFIKGYESLQSLALVKTSAPSLPPTLLVRLMLHLKKWSNSLFISRF